MLFLFHYKYIMIFGTFVALKQAIPLSSSLATIVVAEVFLKNKKANKKE